MGSGVQTGAKWRFPGVFLLAVVLSFFMAVIIQRAWLCDDAYISFRTLDNLINGYKLTWNTIERVQAYTHPLWLFLLSPFYALTREIYYTSIVLSLVLTLGTVLLYCFWLSRSPLMAVFGVAVLALSNAFVDYSTSGLENAFSHLLLAVFCTFCLSRDGSKLNKKNRRRIFILSLLASLAGLNRLDSMLLYLPVLLLVFWQNRSWKNTWVMAVGQIPLLLWELFSLFYYGFPFPNTAYAKLNTGIPAEDLWQQGGFYLLNSWQRDPITLLTILAALTVSLFFGVQMQRDKSEVSGWLWKSRPLSVALAAGMLLYLVYIVRIGGDFMSGRFFSLLLLAAVIILAQLDPRGWKKGWAIALIFCAVILGALAPVPTVFLKPYRDFTMTDDHGITDERLWYFGDFGLFSPERKPDLALSAGRGGAKARQEAGNDLRVIAIKNTGVYGYFAGPHVYVIDLYALSDPLLARLPAIYEAKWRVGHYKRALPDGYIATIYGLGSLADQNLAAYYEKLSLVTRGKLTDPQRLVEIWNLNTGKYDFLINKDAYRYPR